MQELISALTAHEEECSREFEADLSAFCTRHMDAQLVQQLRQLVAEGEEDLAYRAFYALTIIYRNRKDYQQLQALFEENPRFAGHPSYHHLLILFQLEAETFFDALELLELAREDARQHRDNAGYLHLFAHLFVYTCEKSRGEMREQVRREYYDDVERAVEDAIRLDCDGDAVVLLIEQIGGAACHEGYRSCFSRELRDGKVSRCSELVFDPKEVYNG